MEPISIIGGIVAVGQATGAIAKCAENVYQVTYKAGALAGDVELFASHIDVFGSTVSNVHSTIRDHYMKNNRSAAIRKLHEHATLDALASQSKHLIRRVKKLRPQLKAHETSLGIWARIQWVRKKEERKDICLWMDRVQLSFQSIMHQILYEALEQRAANPSPMERELCDFRQEMKKHRRLMRTHMKTMRVFKQRHERLNHVEFQVDKEDHSIALDNIEKVLLEIGEEIVMDGASARSSVISTTTGGPSSDEDANYEVRVSDAPVNLGGPRNPSSPIPPEQLSRSKFFNPDMRLDVAIHPLAVPPDRQHARTPESLSPSTSSLRIRTQEHPGPVVAPQWDEGDYMDVQASDSLLHLDPDLNSEVVEGYVNSNAGPTNAILNSKFPENVISQLYATDLGLEIEYFHGENDDSDAEDGDNLDDNGGTEIDFGGGNVQLVIGRVKFGWKSGPEPTYSRLLKVDCLVCEYVPFQTPLIFGERYLNRRRFYWGK